MTWRRRSVSRRLPSWSCHQDRPQKKPYGSTTIVPRGNANFSRPDRQRSPGIYIGPASASPAGLETRSEARSASSLTSGPVSPDRFRMPSFAFEEAHGGRHVRVFCPRDRVRVIGLQIDIETLLFPEYTRDAGDRLPAVSTNGFAASGFFLLSADPTAASAARAGCSRRPSWSSDAGVGVRSGTMKCVSNVPILPVWFSRTRNFIRYFPGPA